MKPSIRLSAILHLLCRREAVARGVRGVRLHSLARAPGGLASLDAHDIVRHGGSV